MRKTVLSPVSGLLVLLTLLGIAGCHSGKSVSSVKAVVGEDAAGGRHAVGILPLRNLVDLEGGEASLGSRYARELLDTPFWGVVDCIDTPDMPGIVALKDLELSSVLGMVYIDENRRLVRRRASTGAIDETILCVVQGPRLYSIDVLRGALAGDGDTTLGQAVYLGLRGNTIKKQGAIDYATRSALMIAFLDQYAHAHNLAKPTRASLEDLLARYDKDFNPCSAAAIDAARKRFDCALVPTSADAYDYKYKGTIEDYTSLLVSRLSELHIDSYAYHEGATPVHTLWEVLSSTSRWGSASGKAGKLGDALAGRKQLDFDAYFATADSDRERTRDAEDTALALTAPKTGTKPPALTRPKLPKLKLPIAGALGSKVSPLSQLRPKNAPKSVKPKAPGRPAGPAKPVPGLTSADAIKALDARTASLSGKNGPQGFAGDLEARMAENQAQLGGEVKQQIQSGSMRPSGPPNWDGSTTFTNAKTGDVAFVRKDGSFQSWDKLDAKEGGKPGTNEWFDKAAGNPHAPGDNVGLSQSVSKVGDREQRNLNVAFAGDKKAGEAGIDQIPMKVDAKGRPYIDCADKGPDGAKARAALAKAEVDYKDAQRELSGRDTALQEKITAAKTKGEPTEELLQQQRTNREQMSKNKDVYDRVQAMRNCKAGAKLRLQEGEGDFAGDAECGDDGEGAAADETGTGTGESDAEGSDLDPDRATESAGEGVPDSASGLEGATGDQAYGRAGSGEAPSVTAGGMGAQRETPIDGPQGGLEPHEAEAQGGLDADGSEPQGGLDAGGGKTLGDLDAGGGEAQSGLDAGGGDAQGRLDAGAGRAQGGLDAGRVETQSGLDAATGEAPSGPDAAGSEPPAPEPGPPATEGE